MRRESKDKSRELTRVELKDLKILASFTCAYCKGRHQAPRLPLRREEAELDPLKLDRYPLCDGCREFLSYALDRRLRCPLDPKPACKHCPVHCYRPERRQQVRDIMRFAGPYLMRRGRLDLLWHYFF